jgi:hypothetical protein
VAWGMIRHSLVAESKRNSPWTSMSTNGFSRTTNLPTYPGLSQF